MRLVLKSLVLLSLAGVFFISCKDCVSYDPSRSQLVGVWETMSTLSWALLCTPLYCIPFIVLFPKYSRWVLLSLVVIGFYINSLQWHQANYYHPSHDLRLHRPYSIAAIARSDEHEVISQSMTSFLYLRNYLEGATVFLTQESKANVTSFLLRNLARAGTLHIELFNSELTLLQYNRVTSVPGIKYFQYGRGVHVFVIPSESRRYRLYSFQGNILFLDEKNVS